MSKNTMIHVLYKRVSYAIYFNACLALLAVQLNLIVLTTPESLNTREGGLQQNLVATETFLKNYH